MKRTLLGVLTLAAMTVLVAGCDNRSGGNTAVKGRVAVVDLDRVAREMGWIELIQESLQVITQRLQADVNQLLNQLKTSYEAEIKKLNLPEKPEQYTDEQKKKAFELGQQAQRQQQSIQNQANQQRAAAERQLVNQYREEIKPKAKEVAKEMGMSVILVQNEPAILHVDDEVNITDRVVERLNKEGKRAPVRVPVAGPSVPMPMPAVPTPPAPPAPPASQPAK